jgi:pyruvate,water dikinase
VAFSIDPVSGNEAHVVINATWGLGEAIVSGTVTPDQITVGPFGRIIEYTVGAKDVMVIADESSEAGTREVPVPRAMRRLPALSEAHVVTIASFIRNLAMELGHPTDLEGGLAGDCLYVFQARPITATGTPAT